MFQPDYDLWYHVQDGDYKYCVIKKPEPIPGEDLKKLMVTEGCTVHADGKWYYWRLSKPMEYKTWCRKGDWAYTQNADIAVKSRLNRGRPGLPAPRFIPRTDNNWIQLNPREVPMCVTEEMLGDLRVAHLMLSEEVQEGGPLVKPAA